VLNFENTAILDISYSTLQGWTGSLGGTNNNGLDPLFLRTPSPGPDTIWGTTDDDYGDLRLSSNSPAIDSGDSLAVPADTYDIDNDGNTTEALPLDLAGQPRFYDDPTRSNTGNGNPPVDRGAYENNLATTVWNAPTGGRFDLAANWFGGVPASTVRAIFNSDVGLNRVYTVTMPTNQSAYSLSVLSNLVTINLRGLTTSGNLTLASPGSDQNAPSLLISGPATVPTGLSITNTGTSLRSVFGSNAVVAAASDSAGELTVSGLRASLLLSDSLDAGLAGSASLRVINRGQLSSATLRTGVNAGATSTVLVSGVSGAGDSLLALGGPGADELVISSRGTTTMQVQNEGVVAGLDALDRTVFAEYAGSVANVTMSGANTIWDTSQDDLIISRGGTTNLVVTNGATMNTATANRIVLGELEGSVANITIGPGSSWNESVQSVVLAGQGAANINMLPGSALNFQSNLVINPAGSISGSGTITGGVFNVGTVRVGNSPGELTIVGDYRQLPAQNDPDPARANRSGSLEMEIAGTAPGQYDRLIVSGDVDLGGGLVVNLAPQVVLPESGTLQIITGARGNTRFDVALLPTLGLDRFARVVYGDADEPISIGVQPIQAPFSPGEPRGTPVSGTPSAVIVADFNADGAPDLAIAVPNITPGSAGQAFVFRNAGVSGGVWQGFQSVLQLNTGIDPSDIDAADLDGDGLIDLVVSNRGSDSLSRFQNTSLGSSFLTQPTIAVGDGPSSVSATVLYNDAGTNLPDLIVSNETAGTIQLLRSNDAIGGPTITPQQTITVPGRPRRTRPIDLDDDKRNEAVSMIVSDGSAGSVNAVIPMVRVSPTLYGLLAPVPVADDPQDLVVSNISAVPTPDVAVVCASGAISVLRNQLLPDQPIGSQPFAPAVNLPVQGAGLDIAAYDIDADGDNDLVVVLSDVVRDVYTLRNLTDDPTTISLATPLAADTGANPLLVAGADVDGSGVFDVIHLGPPPPGRCPECLGGDNLFVLLPVAPTGCDSVDFNNNGVFPEDQDVVDFIDVLAGGTPSTCNATLGCQDIDFNNNGVFPEDQDVIDFFNVLAGGSCP
jgi:T5SS/PEP-CTERM-associated repeat protein